MPKSVDFLQTNDALSTLVLVSKKEIDYMENKLSDFERFAFTCENFVLLSGTDFRERWLKMLVEDCGKDVDTLILPCRDTQKKIWRFIHLNEAQKSAEPLILKDIAALNPAFAKPCKAKADKGKGRVVLPLEFFFCKDFDFGLTSLNGFVKNVSDHLGKIDAPTVLVDAKTVQCVKVNPYLAEQAYQRIVCDENYNEIDMSVFCCWLLSNVTKQAPIEVIIRVDGGKNEINNAASLIEYIKKRGSYSNACVCFPLIGNIDIHALKMLLAEKNISSEIIIPEETDETYIKGRLSDLLREIPLTAIHSCEYFNSEKEHKMFESAMYSILSEQCGTEKELFECMRELLS